MNFSTDPLERRLQLSGLLLIIGLLTEAVCLFRARPLSFLALVGIGGLFLFLGIVLYLFSIVSIKHHHGNSGEITRDAETVAAPVLRKSRTPQPDD
jgi:hypothetical protein